MSVRAIIPLRLKVDARTVAGDPAQLEETVARAIDRALAALVEEFSDRGDGLIYDVSQPSIRWSGSGLKGLDPNDQSECAEMLTRLIEDRARTGLAGDTQAQPVPEVLPDDASAPFDERRAMLGSYVLDSYDTPGEGAATPSDRPPQRAAVIFLGRPEAFREMYDPARWTVDLYTFTNQRQLLDAVRAVIRSAAAQGSPVQSGRVGFIYRGRGSAGQITRRVMMVDGATDPDAIRSAGDFLLGGGSQVLAATNDEDEVGVDDDNAITLSGIGVHNLERRTVGGELDAALTNYVYSGMSEGVEAYIRNELGPNQTEADANGVRARVRLEVLAMVRERMEIFRTENPQWPLTFAVYTDTSNHSIPGAYPNVFSGSDTLPLYPILYAEARPQGNEGDINSGTGGAGGDAGDEGATTRQQDGGTGGEGTSGTGTGAGGDGGTGDAGDDGTGAGGSGGDDDTATGHVRPIPFPFPAPTLSNPGDTLYCEPFNHEATLDELGDAGNTLSNLMRRIAWRLSMPVCKYPGQFMVNAAKVWGGRAAAASGFAGERSADMRRIEGQDGALGDLDFEAQPSPVLETIRHLAGTTPLMTAMINELYDVYNDPANSAKLGGYFEGRGVLWVLRLRETYVPELKGSIGYGFKVACQSCLLQACLSSRQQILERLGNFENYWPLFDSLLRTFLAPQGQLELLREQLQSHYRRHAPDMESVVSATADNWRDARQALVASIGASDTAEILEDSEDSIGVATYAGTIESMEGGHYGIRDPNGKVWTRDELSQAIAMRSGIAQAIDPLVGKVADLPQAIVIAQNSPATSKQYIRALLEDMLEKNSDVIAQAEGSPQYAFLASQINESYSQNTIPGTSIQMGGIHLVAHNAIGDAFLGDPNYGIGIEQAFGIELGKQSLMQFAELTGTILISIVCPPLGIAVGIAVAGAHLYVAYEQQDIVGGLFDNDQVMSNASAELNLFMAELEAVFSIIPLAGKALSLGGRGAMGVARGGLRNAGRRAARGITRDIAQEMAAALKHGLPYAFMRELAQDQLTGKIIEQGMTPIIRQLQTELSLTDLALPAPDAAASNPDIASEAERARAAHNIDQSLREGDDERARRSEGAEAARRGDP